MLDLAVQSALRALSLHEAEMFAHRLFEAPPHWNNLRQLSAFQR
jgi:hypothetical protein